MRNLFRAPVAISLMQCPVQCVCVCGLRGGGSVRDKSRDGSCTVSPEVARLLRGWRCSWCFLYTVRTHIVYVYIILCACPSNAARNCVRTHSPPTDNHPYPPPPATVCGGKTNPTWPFTRYLAYECYNTCAII